MTDSDGKKYNTTGGHAMTVTGKTEDGLLIVSSWGEKYFIDPNVYKKDGYKAIFQVIEYEK